MAGRKETVKDFGTYRVARVFHHDTEYDEYDEKFIRLVCVVKLQVRKWFLARHVWVTIKEWEADAADAESREFFEGLAIEAAQTLLDPCAAYTNECVDGVWETKLLP